MATTGHRETFRTQEGRSVRGRPATIEPHPLANELAEDRDFETDPADELRHAAPSRERRMGGWLAIVAGLLAIVGIVIASIVFYPNWMWIAVSALVIVAVGLLFLWPVLMAHETKLAQDEDVRDVGRRR